MTLNRNEDAISLQAEQNGWIAISNKKTYARVSSLPEQKRAWNKEISECELLLLYRETSDKIRGMVQFDMCQVNFHRSICSIRHSKSELCLGLPGSLSLRGS